MVVDRQSGGIQHSTMAALPSFVEPGSVLVLNNSRVRKARLMATAEGTGGRVEFLLLAEEEPGSWRFLSNRTRKQKPGKRYRFPGGLGGALVEGEDGRLRLRFDEPIEEAYLDSHGLLPLPPYIKRPPTAADEERYQTVFAEVAGSAAAPTAGLHFDRDLLEALRDRDAEVVFLTLHVGLGTFLPIRAQTVEEHEMHEERFCIPDETAQIVNRAREEKRPVLAVGTTVVRALESACRRGDGSVQPGVSATDLFIYPGYEFRIVDRLLTNFHTPRSTLLVLVCAFAGKALIERAYAAAVYERYRFFSYGDAMLLC